MAARRLVSLIPTPATRALARRMIADAEKTSGPDAALRHLRDVHPDQLVALVGVLLTSTKLHKKSGRPALPLKHGSDERRRGYNAYRRKGDRSEWAVSCYREYQRVNQATRRGRRGLQEAS